jgi:hypothetical protein
VMYDEGDLIALDDGTAAMFARFGYVTIEADAESTPTVPVAQSPLLGGDLTAVPVPVPVDPVVPEIAVEPPLSASGFGGFKDGQDSAVGAGSVPATPDSPAPTEPEVKESGKSKSKSTAPIE